MDNLKNLRKRHMVLMIALLVVTGVIGALGGEAMASPQCVAGGGQQVGLECQITSAITAPCPYSLTLPNNENLRITSTGSIKCDGLGAASGANITLNVPGGNMVMEVGSEITSENTTGGGNGGNIAITVSGNFLMQGTGVALPAPPGAGTIRCSQVAGACISSSDLEGGGGQAGNITITVGNFPNTPPVGIFTMEPGSAVMANSTTGSAGAIVVSSGLSMDIDGLVRSYGGITGTGGNQAPGGGPVTLKSGCQLVITPDGIVSSEGKNPGADLVHLEGCEVVVNGLVRSIAIGNGGHAVPNSPANHCNNDPITHPVVNTFTACVEIWANNITINSILPNKGEVSADGVTDNTPADTRAWIDLFAKNNITINNDNVGLYSVHANAGNTEGDFGGLITIKAEQGEFVVTGPANTQSFAVQANAPGQAGQGGDVIIQAGSNVELNAGVVLAQGGTTPLATGGTIAGRSFNGVLSGQQPGLLNANAVVVVGAITLQGCGNPAVAGDGVVYTGTTVPLATILADLCGGNPVLPGAVIAALNALAQICDNPVCAPGGECEKRGTKFRDLDGDGQPREVGEPGLSGWVIRAYQQPGNVFAGQVTTDALGNYAFAGVTALACGTYTFCEVLQPLWLQTFPAAAGGEVVSCVGIEPNPAIVLGPLGYEETLIANTPSLGNDFGNFLDEGECPKFPNLIADQTITIDPANATQIQDAIDALTVGQTLLILPHLGKKTENITINRRVHVVGCSITLDADDVSAPVVTIGAGAANGSTTDVHATDSTVAGYKIEGASHLVKNVRSFDNAIGFWITGNSNTVLGAQGTTGNGVGFKIEGDGNTVDSATDVSSSTSHGAHLTSGASGNTIKKSTFTGNSGEGIFVEGAGNIVSENKLYSNVLNGIRVTGASNQVVKNLAGDKNKGNGLDGILVSGTGGPLTENTARSNGANGIEVSGTGHTLTKNTAGGDAQQANTLCEFVIGPSNANGGNNKANGQNFSFAAAGAPCVDP